uniref:Uncharacterized protein LOC117356482 n=1 Tax=Geotrypetes seraphini TaxID=260995 RepID=A0A6P8Q5S3_GEOSA|nr:uncharacterized protein LOC117356482 [Geotrypetes seraphini]
MAKRTEKRNFVDPMLLRSEVMGTTGNDWWPIRLDLSKTYLTIYLGEDPPNKEYALNCRLEETDDEHVILIFTPEQSYTIHASTEHNEAWLKAMDKCHRFIWKMLRSNRYAVEHRFQWMVYNQSPKGCAECGAGEASFIMLNLGLNICQKCFHRHELDGGPSTEYIINSSACQRQDREMRAATEQGVQSDLRRHGRMRRIRNGLKRMWQNMRACFTCQ